MPKFNGTEEDLRRVVETIGEQGLWRNTNSNLEFRSAGGGILNWSPSTGSLWFQGKGPACTMLLQRFRAQVAGHTLAQLEQTESHRARPSESYEEIEEVTITVIRRRTLSGRR